MMAYDEWDNGGLMDKNQKNEIRDHYGKMVSVLLGNERGFMKKENIVIAILNDDCELDYDIEEALKDAIKRDMKRHVGVNAGCVHRNHFWRNIYRIVLYRFYPISVHGEPASVDFEKVYDLEKREDGTISLKSTALGNDCLGELQILDKFDYGNYGFERNEANCFLLENAFSFYHLSDFEG